LLKNRSKIPFQRHKKITIHKARAESPLSSLCFPSSVSEMGILVNLGTPAIHPDAIFIFIFHPIQDQNYISDTLRRKLLGATKKKYSSLHMPSNVRVLVSVMEL
jgi:hypothetical protein